MAGAVVVDVVVAGAVVVGATVVVVGAGSALPTVMVMVELEFTNAPRGGSCNITRPSLALPNGTSWKMTGATMRPFEAISTRA